MAKVASAPLGVLRGILVALLLLGFPGCNSKEGEATVLTKEYIPAALADQTVKDQKGTPHEQQTTPEQWKIMVEMRADLRKVDLLVEPAEWQKLKVGDRVNVRYSQGKYTGTVWHSELK